MERINRRSSILKKTSNTEESSPTQTFTRSNKRISFSGKKNVKEFMPVDGGATIWVTSYEESAEGPQLGKSISTQAYNSMSTMKLRNSKVVVKYPTTKSVKTKKKSLPPADLTLESTSVSDVSKDSLVVIQESLDISLMTDEMKHLKFIKTPEEQLKITGIQKTTPKTSPNIYCSFTLSKTEFEKLRLHKDMGLILSDVTPESYSLQESNGSEYYNENINKENIFGRTVATNSSIDSKSLPVKGNLAPKADHETENYSYITEYELNVDDIVQKSINQDILSSVRRRSTICKLDDIDITLENNEKYYTTKVATNKLKTTHEHDSLELTIKDYREAQLDNQFDSSCDMELSDILPKEISTSTVNNLNVFNDIQPPISTQQEIKDDKKLEENIDIPSTKQNELPLFKKRTTTYNSHDLDLTLQEKVTAVKKRSTTYNSDELHLTLQNEHRDNVIKEKPNRCNTNHNFADLDITLEDDSEKENKIVSKKAENEKIISNIREFEKQIDDMELSVCEFNDQKKASNEGTNNVLKTSFNNEANISIGMKTTTEKSWKHKNIALDAKNYSDDFCLTFQNTDDNIIKSLATGPFFQTVSDNQSITAVESVDDSDLRFQNKGKHKIQLKASCGQDIFQLSTTEVKDIEMQTLNFGPNRKTDMMDLSILKAEYEIPVKSSKRATIYDSSNFDLTLNNEADDILIHEKTNKRKTDYDFEFLNFEKQNKNVQIPSDCKKYKSSTQEFGIEIIDMDVSGCVENITSVIDCKSNSFSAPIINNADILNSEGREQIVEKENKQLSDDLDLTFLSNQVHISKSDNCNNDRLKTVLIDKSINNHNSPNNNDFKIKKKDRSDIIFNKKTSLEVDMLEIPSTNCEFKEEQHEMQVSYYKKLNQFMSNRKSKIMHLSICKDDDDLVYNQADNGIQNNIKSNCSKDIEINIEKLPKRGNLPSANTRTTSDDVDLELQNEDGQTQKLLSNNLSLKHQKSKIKNNEQSSIELDNSDLLIENMKNEPKTTPTISDKRRTTYEPCNLDISLENDASYEHHSNQENSVFKEYKQTSHSELPKEFYFGDNPKIQKNQTEVLCKTKIQLENSVDMNISLICLEDEKTIAETSSNITANKSNFYLDRCVNKKRPTTYNFNDLDLTLETKSESHMKDISFNELPSHEKGFSQKDSQKENMINEKEVKKLSGLLVPNDFHSTENINLKTIGSMECENDKSQEDHCKKPHKLQKQSGVDLGDDESICGINKEEVLLNNSDIKNTIIDDTLNCKIELRECSMVKEFDVQRKSATNKRGTIYSLDDLELTFQNDKKGNLTRSKSNYRETMCAVDDLELTESENIKNKNELLKTTENTLKVVVKTKEQNLKQIPPLKINSSNENLDKSLPGPSLHFQSKEANDVELSICGKNNQIAFNSHGNNIVVKSTSKKSNSTQKFTFRGHDELNISFFECDEKQEVDSSMMNTFKQNENLHTSCKGTPMDETNLRTGYCTKKSPKKKMFSTLLSKPKSARQTILFSDKENMCMSPELNSNKSIIKNELITAAGKDNLDNALEIPIPYCEIQDDLTESPACSSQIHSNTIDSIDCLRYSTNMRGLSSKSSCSNTNSNFSLNTTEALCNVDVNKMTGKGYRRNLINTASLDNITFDYKRYKDDYVEKIAPQDDIEKTQLSLVDSLNLTNSFDNLNEPVNVKNKSITNLEVSKEETLCLTSGNLVVAEEMLCKKCINCRATLARSSMDVDKFAFTLVSTHRNEIDFSAYNKLKNVHSIKDVLNAYKKRRESNNLESSHEESILFPAIPTVKFLLENYMNQYELKIKEEIEIGAVLPVAPSFEFLLKNKIESQQSNWIFNDLYMFTGLMEFRHKQITSVYLLFQFAAKDFYSSADKIAFENVSLKRFNKHERLSSLDVLIQKELFAKVPCVLTSYCSSFNELFDFLEYIDGFCEKAIKLGKDLARTSIRLFGMIEKDDSDNCFIRKLVKHKGKVGTLTKVDEYLIQIRSIEKISYKDVILPPISDLNKSIYELPEGLEFLIQFLSDPSKFLNNL